MLKIRIYNVFNKVEDNKVKILGLIDELKLILEANHDASIFELDKLKNIVKDKNYTKSNININFSSTFRRVQEIGIYNDSVDRLFDEFYSFTLAYQ